ncbi:hypothetical protein WJX81_007425 [Elliptochloris bilobata]|uniref:Cullin neddylation domain-containing protein n=1 Tax=Elliptochloris bilobata TaxID=381761 RepID=A0AAW1S0A9_9CHLO
MLEVVSQLQGTFQPDLRQIKKRIEDLIAREFLERDLDNANSYRYLAGVPGSAPDGCAPPVRALACTQQRWELWLVRLGISRRGCFVRDSVMSAIPDCPAVPLEDVLQHHRNFKSTFDKQLPLAI